MFLKRGSNDMMVGMTNKDNIVIPRAELPEAEYGINHIGPYVTLANHPSNLNYRISASSAAQTRKLALEQLALAEAIDHALAEQAKKADEQKLFNEAEALHGAVNSGRLGIAGGWVNAYWISIARAARELHGK